MNGGLTFYNLKWHWGVLGEL